MASDQRKIWFPAKRYGWGWGLPVAWQGWIVLLAYVGGLALCARVMPPSARPVACGACVAALTALFVCICWLKGEKPRWHWGRSRDE